jgi:hypothetical protein
MQERPYVINDLANLRIDALFPDRAIGVRNATVLHKRHNGTLLLREDVIAIRDLFATSDVSPAKKT